MHGEATRAIYIIDPPRNASTRGTYIIQKARTHHVHDAGEGLHVGALVATVEDADLRVYCGWVGWVGWWG